MAGKPAIWSEYRVTHFYWSTYHHGCINFFFISFHADRSFSDRSCRVVLVDWSAWHPALPSTIFFFFTSVHNFQMDSWHLAEFAHFRSTNTTLHIESKRGCPLLVGASWCGGQRWVVPGRGLGRERQMTVAGRGTRQSCSRGAPPLPPLTLPDKKRGT